MVFDAFCKAVRDLCRPQVLAMVALPIMCATVLWLLIGWLSWEQLTAWINGWMLASSAGHWIASWAGGLLQFISVLIALALLAPGVLITAMLITEFFTLPGLVNFVAQRDYPALKRLHGGTLMGSVLNSTLAIVIFALLWLITLPLWFTGIGAVLVPLFNSAWLNQRLCRYDALSDHADSEELRAVIAQNRRTSYLLGLLLAVFYYVPLLNLLVPALSGLAFTHFQLAALARLRGNAGLRAKD